MAALVTSGALFLLSLLLTLAAGQQQPIVVNIGCGPALGSIRNLSASAAVGVWHGIPFGAQPVRFAAPSPVPCWSGTYNATYSRAECIQPSNAGDEDCLTLHVYAPLRSDGSLPPPDSLPVHFYIHGGGLMDGSGNNENPAVFSSKTNVVSVVINYRLAWSGFLVTAGMVEEGGGAAGNWGIMDQQLALRWVQANIASFGGDKARVVLAGQSSGGTSIFALLSSPASVGLFRGGAIALSGSPNMSMPLSTAVVQNVPMVADVGCRNASSPSTELACLRALPTSVLSAHNLRIWGTPGLFGNSNLNPAGFGAFYGGLAIVDGRVLTHSFEEAMAVGLVDVPLIMGAEAQECEMGPSDDVTAYNLSQWRAYLETRVAGWGPNASALADGIYSAYLADALLSPQRAYDTLSTDYGLTCAFNTIARGAKRGGKYTSPIYLYVNQWQASVPTEGGPSGGRRWAYHTLDFSMAWENWPRPHAPANGSIPGPTDFAQSTFLQTAWGSLMHTGRIDPVASAGWASVETVPGWPESVGVMRISSPDLPPFEPSAFVAGLRDDVCAMLARRGGFDERFWWVN